MLCYYYLFKAVNLSSGRHQSSIILQGTLSEIFCTGLALAQTKDHASRGRRSTSEDCSQSVPAPAFLYALSPLFGLNTLSRNDNYRAIGTLVREAPHLPTEPSLGSKESKESTRGNSDICERQHTTHENYPSSQLQNYLA
jgi:hypothetical protein